MTTLRGPAPKGCAMFFNRKRKVVKKTYDAETYRPILRRSICTGETVAGFRHKHDGSFKEVMLVRDDQDLKEFMDTYGLTEVPETEY